MSLQYQYELSIYAKDDETIRKVNKILEESGFFNLGEHFLVPHSINPDTGTCHYYFTPDFSTGCPEVEEGVIDDLLHNVSTQVPEAKLRFEGVCVENQNCAYHKEFKGDLYREVRLEVNMPELGEKLWHKFEDRHGHSIYEATKPVWSDLGQDKDLTLLVKAAYAIGRMDADGIIPGLTSDALLDALKASLNTHHSQLEQHERNGEQEDAPKLEDAIYEHIWKSYDQNWKKPAPSTMSVRLLNAGFVDVNGLLEEAKKSKYYFQIKGILAGVPVNDLGLAVRDTLLKAAEGTDPYIVIRNILSTQDHAIHYAKAIATGLDRFSREHDLHEYTDQVSDVETHIHQIEQAILNGETEPFEKYLNEAIQETDIPSVAIDARNLLYHLNEYQRDYLTKKQMNPLSERISNALNLAFGEPASEKAPSPKTKTGRGDGTRTVAPDPQKAEQINSRKLLRDAASTHLYFQVKSLLTGIQTDEHGMTDANALLDTARGTDVYDLVRNFIESERDPIGQDIKHLASDLLLFAKSYDTYEYLDTVSDEDLSADQIAESLRKGDTKPFEDYLETVIEESEGSYERQDAITLSARLVELKSRMGKQQTGDISNDFENRVNDAISRAKDQKQPDAPSNQIGR